MRVRKLLGGRVSGIGGKPLVYIQTILGSLNTTYPVRFISETNHKTNGRLREAIRPMHSSEHMGIDNGKIGTARAPHVHHIPTGRER
jgi:hypothetical protein